MSISRSIGYSFIQPMVKQGLSANRIYSMLVKAGVGYRKQDMLADIRVFSGRHANQTQVTSLGGNNAVPTNYMVETELRRPYKYRVYGETHYYDFETGDEIIQEGSFYTDELAKKQDWEQAYVDNIRNSPSVPNTEIMSFRVTSVEHNEDFSY